MFTCSSAVADRASFHPAPEITDHDIDKLARAIRQRVLRYLRKHGKLPEDDAPADEPARLERSVLQVLGAAAVQGRIALGPNAGACVPRLGRGSLDAGGESRRGKLRADAEGLLRLCCCRLHAEAARPRTQRPAKQVLAPRRGLHPRLRSRTAGEPAKRVADSSLSRPPQEAAANCIRKLCRYAARLPVVHERLSLSVDGKKVLYKLKRRWKDGSTHVVLAPITLIERLAALVPRPRVHLTTYHGVFAPAASFRDRSGVPSDHGSRVLQPFASVAGDADPGVVRWACVPEPEPEHDDVTDTEIECQHPRRDAADPTHATRQQRPRRRFSWAELLKRVFLLDVLTCPHCGGKRTLLAFLTDPRIVDKILAHLELPTDSPPVAPARPPPEPALPFA